MWRVTTVVRGKDANGNANHGRFIAIDTITLDRHARVRRRIALKTDSGRDLLLDLAETTVLADGDALVVEGGHVIVKAMDEPLLKIQAASAVALARIAWHLGNRHTPAEITADALYILPDHVLAHMIEGLGGRVQNVVRPFEPEGGAYGGHGNLMASHHGHAGHTHDHRPLETDREG